MKRALLKTKIPTASLPTTSGSNHWSTAARKKSTGAQQI
jgi:hypothetical protein